MDLANLATAEVLGLLSPFDEFAVVAVDSSPHIVLPLEPVGESAAVKRDQILPIDSQGGAIFGYSVVFPIMFDFLSGFDSDFVESAWTMREVFALTTRLFLAFGVAFELPVAVFFLAMAGIVDAPTLLRGTPYAVLGVFVMAAILTPPDWVSQIFLAVRMVGLYLVGVGVAWVFGAGRRPAAKREEGGAPAA